MPKEEFAHLLKKKRKALGLSQEELRQRLDDAGCNVWGHATVSKWETARAIPREAVIEELEEILCIPKGGLFQAAGKYEVAQYRRISAGEEVAVRPSEGVQLGEEQLERDSTRETDPILLKAQEEHLAEVRGLIEEWYELTYVPFLIEIKPDHKHPITKLPNDPLYQHLKQHLHFPTLWLNQWLWEWYLNWYLDVCEDIIRGIRRDWRFRAGKTDDDESPVWVETKPYAYHDPIVKRIHDKMIQSRNSNFSTRMGAREHEFSTKQTSHSARGKSAVNVFSLYVDDILVGKCFDTEKAISLYRDISDEHLNDDDTKRLLILFTRLGRLEEQINESLYTILARRDYVRNTCALCPRRKGGNAISQTQPDWATPAAYNNQLEEHFKMLASMSAELSVRLRIMHRFKERWAHKGKIWVVGDIVDGFSLHSDCPGDPFVLVEVQPINPLDPDKRIYITHPVDSLIAHCLLVHFYHQFPDLALYEDWRKVNFENIETAVEDKLNMLTHSKAFEFNPDCPVCYGLKTVFNR